MAIMKAMEACLEERDACLEKREPTPEKMEGVAEHQEVPNREVTVEIIGALEDRYRDQQLACIR
jgi:hypothetical protein